jgi:multidrug efflux pump subunit AcrA (membrane-fusion protein)
MYRNLRKYKFFLLAGVLLLTWLLNISTETPVIEGGNLSVTTPALADDGQLYTCGMHPNVVHEGPGLCPICSMDLTPMKAGTAGKSKNKKSGKKTIKYWQAPMDPAYIRDKPGKSPMGMDLVPVYEEDDDGNDDASTIRIDPAVVQNMGVRVGHVTQGSIHRNVRTIGTVDVAEDQLSVVNLRYSGWVQKIYVDETGVLVKKGQSLFRIYSPELVSSQDEYLLAIENGKDSPLAESARQRLLLFGLSIGHIKRLEAEGKALTSIVVNAPLAGYVLHKNIVQGARVTAGKDLYRIGNLDKIWVNAEVYEYDAPWIRVGQDATMELSFQPGRLFKGQVGYIYPTLNPKSRTLTVRLEFQNPGVDLKPGMFTIVRIETQKKEKVLTIPTEAILHSGERRIVFVSPQLGSYEPRQIVTGLVGADRRTEVLEGLKPNEVIVTSGQFLLDSESQLQEAVQKLLRDRLQSKQGRLSGTGGSSTSQAVTSQHAASQPATSQPTTDDMYVCPMHPQITQDTPGECSICGMELEKSTEMSDSSWNKK